MKFIRDIIAEKRNASPTAISATEIDEGIDATERSDDRSASEARRLNSPEPEETSIPGISDEVSDAIPEPGLTEPDEDPAEHDALSGLLESLTRDAATEAEQGKAPVADPDTLLGAGFNSDPLNETEEPDSLDFAEREEDLFEEAIATNQHSERTDEGPISSEMPQPDMDDSEPVAEATRTISPVGMLKRSPTPAQELQVPVSVPPRTQPAEVTRSTTRLHLPTEEAQSENPLAKQAGSAKPVAPIAVPRPASSRSGGRSGRVKTRILGFGGSESQEPDPFSQGSPSSSANSTAVPVGWLIVIDGPGRGAAITLYDGVSQIGRGTSQAVRLDFGDNSISRENHAAIAFDSEQSDFFIGHGGKANLVRLNNQPVLSTQKISSGDDIRIGETTLRFIGLCGPEFSWRGK